MRFIERYWGLGVAIAIGLWLRFWNLDLKPLWLDETITLLFALGHRYEDIPHDTLLPFADLLGTLTWQPQSCAAIAQSVNEQSTHPPLFFCLMHQWLGYWQESAHSMRWQLRSLSALGGVGAIAVVYGVNRVAFSHSAGLWAAGLMAVSPFAVYLSQEARHYTLPMLTIALSLIPFVQMGQACWANQKPQWRHGFAWASLNSLGFYIHYFCVLALLGQVLVLTTIAVQHRQKNHLRAIAISAGLYGISLVTWLPLMWGHSQRPETDWLKFNGGNLLDWLGPIARLLGGCIVSIVMLPVEDQPLAATVKHGLLMLITAGCTLWVVCQTISSLRKNPHYLPGLQILGSFLGVLWAEYLLLVYGFHKDLTLAFRYNFVFYPVLCALLAVSFAQLGQMPQAKKYYEFRWFLLMVGLASTYFVVTDTAFLKPFHPQQVATKLLHNTGLEVVVLKAYQNEQDVALGISEAIALQQFQSKGVDPSPNIAWSFIKSSDPTSPKLDIKGQSALPSEFTLWRISDLNSIKSSMEASISLNVSSPFTQTSVANCTSDQPEYESMGIQYQRYHCRTS